MNAKFFLNGSGHKPMHSKYDDPQKVSEHVEAGQHREFIGGMWDEIGSLQIEFLKANGLKPGNRLLDIGCGSLRLGVRAADYLDSGNYWGTDISESLLNAGHEREIIPAGLAHKLPRSNLIVDTGFSFPDVPRQFDFAMAQSVFTHLPLNHMRQCLANLAAHVEGACTFFMTVFIAPDEELMKPCKQQPGGVLTHPIRDPYHYSQADLQHVVRGLPWTVGEAIDWGHPRNQKIAAFRKV